MRTILFSFVCVLSFPFYSFSMDLTSVGDRDKGDTVVINGTQRPDLVDYFDSLKQTVVMVKGSAFAKGSDDQLVNSLDVEAGDNLISLAKAIETSDRKSKSQRSSQSAACKCEGCGADLPDPDGNHFQTDVPCGGSAHQTGQMHWMCTDDVCPPHEDDTYDDSWNNNN